MIGDTLLQASHRAAYNHGKSRNACHCKFDRERRSGNDLNPSFDANKYNFQFTG